MLLICLQRKKILWVFVFSYLVELTLAWQGFKLQFTTDMAAIFAHATISDYNCNVCAIALWTLLLLLFFALLFVFRPLGFPWVCCSCALLVLELFVLFITFSFAIKKTLIKIQVFASQISFFFININSWYYWLSKWLDISVMLQHSCKCCQKYRKIWSKLRF